MKRILAILTAVITVISSLCFTVSAEEAKAPVATRAVMIDAETIVVEFSEAVTLSGKPWISIRFSKDGMGYSGATINGKNGVLQFGVSYSMSADGTKLICKYNPKSNTWGADAFPDLAGILDMTNPNLSNLSVVPRLCIEELNDSKKNNAVGVENIKSKANPDKYLTPSKENAIGGGYESVYLYVEKDFNYDMSAPGKEVTDEDLHAKRAVMINENTIVIEFSAPVEFSGDHPFNGIRLTDSTFGVRRGTVDGIEDYLQWTGSLKVYSKDPSKIIWTFNEKGDSWTKFKGMFPELEPIVDKSDERLVQFTKYTPYFCSKECRTAAARRQPRAI